jgi:hypothetical protein
VSDTSDMADPVREALRLPGYRPPLGAAQSVLGWYLLGLLGPDWRCVQTEDGWAVWQGEEPACGWGRDDLGVYRGASLSEACCAAAVAFGRWPGGDR